MKLLHTADWHLGRQFEGYSLEDDHAAMLEQIFAAIIKHTPDALLIAGDVFDRASPPESAIRLFNGFLTRVATNTKTSIVVIGGNHDSGDRIGSYATLSDPGRSLVRGPLAAIEPPLIFNDAYGPVAISAIPFGYEYAARECFANPDIKSPEDVVRAQLAAARSHLPPGARWVIVAHVFVSGGSPSGCERPLNRIVGGIETVGADVFDGAHYVALGHLHRPQSVTSDYIRYSGAPLSYSFDEESCAKSLTLVELGGDGKAAIELIPLKSLRHVRTLRGTLAEILALPASEDFIRPILTDPARLVEPMKRIRERFPNACALSYARDMKAVEQMRLSNPSQTRDPAGLIDDFLMHIRGTAPSDVEAGIVSSHLAELSVPAEAEG